MDKKKIIKIVIIAIPLIWIALNIFIPHKIDVCVDDVCKEQNVWVWSKIPIMQTNEPINATFYQDENGTIKANLSGGSFEDYEINCNNQTGECTVTITYPQHTIQLNERGLD